MSTDTTLTTDDTTWDETYSSEESSSEYGDSYSEDGFFDHYEMGKELGSGAFSKVYRCTKTSTGEQYAVKVISRTDGKMSLDEIQKEVDFMKVIRHDNLVRFEDVFEDSRKLYIVSELLKGGELLNRLIDKGAYSEEVAAGVLRQLVNAVMYLHSKNIVHRDLKPDNILLVGEDTNWIKVSDFGLSGEYTTKKGKRIALTERCGTPEYCAPEVINENVPYDENCDWWSVGVILYILLIGKFPFRGGDRKMEADILQGNLRFHEEAAKLTSEARDLIKKLLNTNPRKRYRGPDVLQHPWMRGAASKKDLSDETLEALKGFAARRRFRKGITTVRGVFRFAALMRRLGKLRRPPPSPPLKKYDYPVCILTGATSGVGFQTALGLVAEGVHVIMAVRDPGAGTAVKERILSHVESTNTGKTPRIDFGECDLASYESVYKFVLKFRKRNLPCNILINCAGVMKPPVPNTEDGTQYSMKVNHFSSFLLTYLLMDVMKLSKGRSRVLMVTSKEHAKVGPMVWSEIQSVPRSHKKHRRAYGLARMANIIFMKELARRVEYKGVAINAVGFGRVRSPVGKQLYATTMFGMSVTKAAQNLIYLALSGDFEGENGKYIVGLKEKSSGQHTEDKRLGQKLWNQSAKVTDLYTWSDKLADDIPRWLDRSGKLRRRPVDKGDWTEESSDYSDSDDDTTTDDTTDYDSDSESDSDSST